MTDAPHDRPSLPARAGLALLAAYKYALSPVFYALGVRCRYGPTCSAYANDAIRAQGLWRGFWLALGRLGRCRPGGGWGYDPAPERRNEAPWWRVWAFRDRFQPGSDAEDALADSGFGVKEKSRRMRARRQTGK